MNKNSEIKTKYIKKQFINFLQTVISSFIYIQNVPFEIMIDKKIDRERRNDGYKLTFVELNATLARLSLMINRNKSGPSQ